MAKVKQEKQCSIYIPASPNTIGDTKEQYKIVQRDGQTLQIPVNKYVVVPLWAGECAKRAGYVNDYQIVD